MRELKLNNIEENGGRAAGLCVSSLRPVRRKLFMPRCARHHHG